MGTGPVPVVHVPPGLRPGLYNGSSRPAYMSGSSSSSATEGRCGGAAFRPARSCVASEIAHLKKQKWGLDYRYVSNAPKTEETVRRSE